MGERDGTRQGRSTHFAASAPAAVERMLATAFLSVRGAHVLQGLVCLASGYRAYRRPRLAAGIETAAVVEFLALSRRYLRAGGCDAAGARADAAFGLAGLVSL